VAYNGSRRHDITVDEVIGEVEEAAHHDFIALDPLFLEFLAADGRPLEDKASFGAYGHRGGVPLHLRLHQAEHLGAEFLAPVGPAYAATGDAPTPEVDGFETWAVDEDLATRSR